MRRRGRGRRGWQNTVLRAAREKQDADQEIARLGAEVKAKAAVRPPSPSPPSLPCSTHTVSYRHQHQHRPACRGEPGGRCACRVEAGAGLGESDAGASKQGRLGFSRREARRKSRRRTPPATPEAGAAGRTRAADGSKSAGRDGGGGS